MREIKFRAWDDFAKCYRGHCDPLTIQMLVFYMLLDRGTLEQYTGLKDKNGKEIYEGDILEVQESKGMGRIVKRIECVDCDVDVQDDYGSWISGWFVGAGIKKREIVGNIHENPELLNA